jgi:hypothetical protein
LEQKASFLLCGGGQRTTVWVQCCEYNSEDHNPNFIKFIYYSSEILQDVGFDENVSYSVTVGMGWAMLCGTILALVSIETLKPKILLLISLGLMFLITLVLTIAMFFNVIITRVILPQLTFFLVKPRQQRMGVRCNSRLRRAVRARLWNRSGSCSLVGHRRKF